MAPYVVGYAFNAAMYCTGCITDDFMNARLAATPRELWMSTEHVPQAIFDHEEDAVGQYCDQCGGEIG